MNLMLSALIIVYIIAIALFNFHLKLFSVYEYFSHLLEDQTDNKIYDYIIVGSGTAGSLIAHQLFKHKNVSFVVLEAGGSGSPLLNPPALGPMLQQTIHDWQYKTVPQNGACLAMHSKSCIWPMGKILGGSAKLNNMLHVRNYLDEIVPWFDKIYNISTLNKYLNDLEEFDLPYEKLKFKTKISSAILEAASELGFFIADGNERTGFFEPFVNQKDGSRWSTSHSLLMHRKPSNGKIITNAFVHKILINSEDKIARGVTYERFGKKSNVMANKGVIISSGTIGSSKLLMLSGIGPKDHLSRVGIRVLQDLPVGENLIDHVSTGLDLVLFNKSFDFSFEDLLNPINAWNYYVRGEGPWTASGCEAMAILKSYDFPYNIQTNSSDNLPDLQLLILPAGVSTDYGMHLRKLIGISEENWNVYFSMQISKNAITIMPIVLHPKSYGYVHLSTSNPDDPPLIDPKYFSSHEDVDVILKGIDLIKKLVETKAMRNIGAYFNDIPFPGCQDLVYDSRDYWECYVRHVTLTVYHPVGTCRMGSADDKNSVVDYNFKVHGLEKLFVVDASIFPSLPSGNPNMAVALMAKIFSDILLKQN